MKKYICSFLLALLSLGMVQAEVQPQPFVVPELRTWQGAEGHTALSGRIVVSSKSLRPVAEVLSADYAALLGRSPLQIVRGKARPGDIVLRLDSRSVSEQEREEGYRLHIGQQVEISAATARGAYWATRTLLQLAEQAGVEGLPCGMAADAPAYGMRGFMLDCGRKYIPMDYLRNLVRVMAYYKMNTLQIHLNDNGFIQFFGGDWSTTYSAFRLECDTYPGLTACDGSYTKAEFRDFIKESAALGVEIIPEIDVPAHSLAFTQYNSKLGSREFGMDHLDLSSPEVIPFVEGLFREYLEGDDPVFCGRRVHLGVDEYSNARPDVVEQFRSFTDHLIRFVESFGKQAVMWGSLSHARGKTPVKSENVVVSCWSDYYADPTEMKEQGYQLISIPDHSVYIVPGATYYHDFLNNRELYDHWTPAHVGKTTFEEGDPALLGGMFAVWNDLVGNGITVKDIHYRTFPALQTLSVKCWKGAQTSLSYDEFEKNRTRLSEAPGVNELVRIGNPGEVVCNLPFVLPGAELPIEEIGYNYAVSFTLDAVAEAKGTELFRSEHAVVYLSDPEFGRLGFSREGYLNTFNYRLPESGKVSLRIEGDPRSTRLYVNGKLHEELTPKTLYSCQELPHYWIKEGKRPTPVVYEIKDKFNYYQTLVFPLHKAGTFRSHLTGLKVEVLPLVP